MCYLAAHSHCFFLLLTSKENICKRRERRISHCLSKVEFLVVECQEVLRCGESNRVMIGVDGLDQNLARQLAATRAAGNLCEQLKGSLGCAKIRHTETDIGRDNSHEC